MSTGGDPHESWPVTITTTPGQARTFLERMANEADSLRGEFETDPGKVLRDFGVFVPPELVPEGIKAPPAPQMAAALRDLEADKELTFWGWLPTFRTFRTFRHITETFRQFGE